MLAGARGAFVPLADAAVIGTPGVVVMAGGADEALDAVVWRGSGAEVEQAEDDDDSSRSDMSAGSDDDSV